MRKIALTISALSLFFNFLSSQLVIQSSFNPASVGLICGIGFDPGQGHVWVYGCFDDSLRCYSTSGNYLRAIERPGNTADDVDIFFSSGPLMLGSTNFPTESLFFINGETGNAEIYGLDKVTGTILATLNTSFGNSHVVGGGFSPVNNQIYLVQDLVPSTAFENLIVEMSSTTGNVSSSFQTTNLFPINYGDLEVTECGQVWVVSSIQSSIAEFSPTGTLQSSYPLPFGVSDLSGIAIDCANSGVWVVSSTGTVFNLSGIDCNKPLSIESLLLEAKLINGKTEIDISFKAESESPLLEHSVDLIHWQSIGNCSDPIRIGEASACNFIHYNPQNGENFYRARVENVDGISEFSNVQSVTVSRYPEIKLFPNPASKEVKISGLIQESYFEIVNNLGQRVITGSVDNLEFIDVISLPNGLYHVMVFTNSSISKTSLMISSSLF